MVVCPNYYQHPQGELHQDLHYKPGQILPARVNLLCRTGRGHAGVDEGVVPGVQQAGHLGEHW